MIDLPPFPDDVRATLPPAVAAYVAALESAVQTLTATVVALQARVTELEARVGQNSTNSSRPPSSDRPGQRPPPPTPTPSGRRPGGQPGHPGHSRVLLPPERVTHTVPCVPEACGGCGAALSPAAAPTDPADDRQQVIDLPPVVAVVTEYHLAARRCDGCGHLTRATLPAAVGTSGFGPRLTALCALPAVGHAAAAIASRSEKWPPACPTGAGWTWRWGR